MSAPEPPDNNPFPGLRPFTKDEEHLFFGRENQVDAMVDKLAATHFLAVVGTSGSGKSSLVNCGLRPSLSRGLMARAGTAWRIAQFRPGNDPIGAMAGALATNGVLFRDYVAEGLPLCEIIETTLRMSRLGLIDIFEQAKLGEGVNLLVVADQFEELFRYQQLGTARGEQDRAEQMTAFVNLLLEVRERAPERIFVVLTMRSDFLGDCTHFPGLPEAINAGQYLVPRLTRDERRAAINGPIQIAGAEISPVLLTTLVNDVGDNPDQLSILQHALNRTWAYWKRTDGKNPLDLADYKAIGTMEHALDEHAKRAYGELTVARQQQICEKMFKALTDKTDPRGVRRPTTIATLCALTDATAAEITDVANVFRKPSRSFLMPPMLGEPEKELDKGTVVDISHESLMRVWKQLNMWADEEARSAGVYRRLAETAAEFSDDEEGLYRGPQLQIALAWRERDRPNETWAARYHPGFAQAMAFLDKSRAKRDADLDKEKRRSERELRKARVFAAVMALLMVGALLALFDSWASRTKAQDEERLANLAKSEAQRNLLKVEITRARLFALLSQADLLDRTKVTLLALETLPDPGNLDPNVSRRLSYDMQGLLGGAIRGEHEFAIITGHTGRVNSVAVSADGQQIVSGSDDSSVRIWDAGTGRELSMLDLEKPVRSVAFTPDGLSIVVVSTDGFASVWSVATRTKERDLPAAGDARVISMALMRDGKRVVTGSNDGNLRIWDIDSGQLQREWKAHDKAVYAMAVMPDGEHIVTASADTTVSIWNAGTGEELRKLIGHTRPVLGVVVSTDGSQIVTRSLDHTVRTWDAGTGEERLQLRNSNSFYSLPLSIAVLPDTQVLLIGWNDNTVRVVGLDEGTLRKWKGGFDPEVRAMQLKAHESGVQAIAVTPDGKRVITGSMDNTIRVWGFVNSFDPPEPSKLNMQEARQKLIDVGKAAVPRCLTTAQRWDLTLGLKPPAWCIERAKYPYNTRDWRDWQAKKPDLKSKLAESFADYADKALKDKGDIGVALEAAEMSIQFNPFLVWTRINLAHAQMLLGDTELARKEYLTHCGTVLVELSDQPLWEDAVIKDFSSLRSKDRFDPLMDEIEAKFKNHDCLPNVDKVQTQTSR